MGDIKFLDINAVLDVHDSLVTKYGGLLGIRDVGLLKSAISQPEASYGGHYLHDDIFHMAAAYAYHIVKNHAFIDGNKRTGSGIALLFLRLNNFKRQINNKEWDQIILDISTNTITKEDVAAYLRKAME